MPLKIAVLCCSHEWACFARPTGTWSRYLFRRAKAGIGDAANWRATNDGSGCCHRAIEEAQRILAEYIEPGSAPRLADVTIDRLRSALDRRDVISALNRL
jgi:hypothetical protein